MKLVRYGPVGQETPGLVDDQGQLRSLKGIVADFAGHQLGDAALDNLRILNLQNLPLV